MRTYGIFISYSPAAKFEGEGLGRYLGEFIRALTADGSTKLVVAAPSWSRRLLQKLFEELGVPDSHVTIIGPRRRPVLVVAHSMLRRRPRSGKRRKRFHFISRERRKELQTRFTLWASNVLAYFAGSRNPVVFALGLALLVPMAIIAIPVGVAITALRGLRRRLLVRERTHPLMRSWTGFRSRVASILKRSQIKRARQSIASYLYKAMHDQETAIMVSMADRRRDVAAWYVPTAFWPLATKLKSPHLICVPDVVISEFPVGFSEFGVPSLRAFSDVASTISSGRNFVTYSEHIKQTVLVRQFGVKPSQVSVVPHAPSSFESKVRVSGFDDNESVTRSLSRAFLRQGLSKATGLTRSYLFDGAEFSFLFYPSQARPSKNLIALLEAYNFLLRQRYIKQKLVLTANGETPSIRAFMDEHDLGRDVLCLHNLSEAELAACYSLADLAVCPSLSEGGMPFTYTEAVSVGTPVVMGDIAVTREIIVDPELREATLFDPYDWRAMADKIEWALQNREELYARQRRFYDEVLAKRTWGDVVNEHIAIMDRIAERERIGAEGGAKPRHLRVRSS